MSDERHLELDNIDMSFENKELTITIDCFITFVNLKWDKTVVKQVIEFLKNIEKEMT